MTLPQKQITEVSLVFKDSDMESENLGSLIRLSLSNGQKTDCSYRYKNEEYQIKIIVKLEPGYKRKIIRLLKFFFYYYLWLPFCSGERYHLCSFG